MLLFELSVNDFAFIWCVKGWKKRNAGKKLILNYKFEMPMRSTSKVYYTGSYVHLEHIENVKQTLNMWVFNEWMTYKTPNLKVESEWI